MPNRKTVSRSFTSCWSLHSLCCLVNDFKKGRNCCRTISDQSLSAKRLFSEITSLEQSLNWILVSRMLLLRKSLGLTHLHMFKMSSEAELSNRSDPSAGNSDMSIIFPLTARCCEKRFTITYLDLPSIKQTESCFMFLHAFNIVWLRLQDDEETFISKACWMVGLDFNHCF